MSSLVIIKFRRRKDKRLQRPTTPDQATNPRLRDKPNVWPPKRGKLKPFKAWPGHLQWAEIFDKFRDPEAAAADQLLPIKGALRAPFGNSVT